MKKKCFYFFISFFAVLQSADQNQSVNSLGAGIEHTLHKRIPYVIQDKKYPEGFIIFYKYNWLLIDGGFVGFLKPEYDTNPQDVVQTGREP